MAASAEDPAETWDNERKQQFLNGMVFQKRQEDAKNSRGFGKMSQKISKDLVDELTRQYQMSLQAYCCRTTNEISYGELEQILYGTFDTMMDTFGTDKEDLPPQLEK